MQALSRVCWASVLLLIVDLLSLCASFRSEGRSGRGDEIAQTLTLALPPLVNRANRTLWCIPCVERPQPEPYQGFV